MPDSVRRSQPIVPAVTGTATVVVVPPLWRKAAAGRRFTLTPPAGTAQHTADLIVTLAGGRGELYVRAPLKAK